MMWCIECTLVKAIDEIIRQQDKNDSAEASEEGQASFGQKRADGLASLAEHFIATATVDGENGGVQALAGHERCQVLIVGKRHLNVESLKAEHACEHNREHGNSDSCPCHTHTPPNIDHQWISMANARRFRRRSIYARWTVEAARQAGINPPPTKKIKAFEAGKLSYSKVRAMTRVATDNNEDKLLKIAKYGTASHIEKLVRKYQRVEKNEQKKEQEFWQEERKLSCYQNDRGMWVIKAILPQEEGGLFVKAIDEIMRKQDKPLPNLVWSSKNVSAETSELNNVSAETSEDINQLDSDLIETCNFPQKRADALLALTEHYIATASVSGDGVTALAGHERCQVILHVDAATLKHAHETEQVEHSNTDSDSDTESCDCHFHNPANLDKQWISLENAKRLSCDASILTVLEDENGNVLNLGKNSRTVSPALKRLLDIRDETCRFPGCCEPKYVDFHHIDHWANKGETCPANLVKLCRFHHRALHAGLYTIEKKEQSTVNGIKGPQVLIFRSSTGEVMEQNPKLPPCTMEGFFEQQWPDIDSHTGDSKWLGEIMDYSMAIDGLLFRRNNPSAGLNHSESI